MKTGSRVRGLSIASRRLAVCAFAACSLAGSIARAQDNGKPLPAAPEAESRKPITLTVNPLGFAVERYGANLEIVPVPHHALVGSAYQQTMPVWILRSALGRSDINSAHPSYGGEVGYRLYSGRRGADGAFIGGSYVAMPLAYARVSNDLKSADLVRVATQGAALDIGVQKVTSSGFTIGGGIGAMYLAYNLPADDHRIPLPMHPHILPRLLLAAGWSF